MKHPSGLDVEHLSRFSWVKNGAASYPYKDLSVELVRALKKKKKKSNPPPQSDPFPQTTSMNRAQNTVTEYLLYYFHPQGIDIISNKAPVLKSE